MPPNSFNALTYRQKNICEYGGLFGVLLSLTCLIQHMAVTRVTDLTKIMLPGYLFAIVSFILLALQKRFAVILLIISGAYSAFIEYQWMRYDVFSLVVLLLFMYHVIIVVTVYVEQIPERLKQKELAKKKEEDEWRGKI